MADLAPVPGNEREPLLDVLRALALCVVLVDNTMLWFSGSAYLPKTAADAFPNQELAGELFRFLVSLRSMTVMTILFGLGFSIQLTRASIRDRSVTAMYLRRLAVMFAFGVGHVVTLWWGDILWVYAITGLLLLPCRKLGTRTLIGLGLVLAIVPDVLIEIPAIKAIAATDPATRTQAREAMLAAMQTSDYGPRLEAHLLQCYAIHVRNLLFFLPWLGGRFILGFVAGRLRLYEHHGAEHLPLFRKLAIGGFVVAVIDAAVRLTVGWRPSSVPLAVAAGFLDELAILGSVGMGISIVVLLMQKPQWQRGLSVLVPVGRMPLTTYLSQSLISTFLFYEWGLGLVRHVQGPKSAFVALAVFALQIALSTWWLSRYRLGPIEWVWRTLAYGQRQPLRDFLK